MSSTGYTRRESPVVSSSQPGSIVIVERVPGSVAIVLSKEENRALQNLKAKKVSSTDIKIIYEYYSKLSPEDKRLFQDSYGGEPQQKKQMVEMPVYGRLKRGKQSVIGYTNVLETSYIFNRSNV
ncbi:hypothetical protein OAJ27_01390 [bacterium]|nr:hypothetical protein [bacterium]